MSQLFGLLSIVLVVNKLPVDIFGTYNLLISSFVVFQIFALSSVQNVYNRYIPELAQKNEYKKLSQLLKYSFAFSATLFTLLIVILVFFKEQFSTYFNVPDFNKYLVAFVIFSYSYFLQLIIDTTLKAFLLHKKVAYITILNAALRVIAYIILYKSLNVNKLLIIEAALSGFFIVQGGIIYLKYITQHLKSNQQNKKANTNFKREIKYGLFSLVNELGVGIVGKTSDYFIVAALSSPLQVGLYAFAHKLFDIVFKVIPFKDIQSVVRPIFFKKYSEDYELHEFMKIYVLMIKILLPIYTIPVLFFYVFGKNIIVLFFNTNFIDAYWVTVVMLSSNILLAFFFPLTLTAQLKERMDVLLYSKIIAVFSIIAGVLGMKYFGIVGVALASFFGGVFNNLFIWIGMRKYPEVHYNIGKLWRIVFLFIASVPFALLKLVQLNFATFILASLCYFIIIMITMANVDFYNNQEKEIILNMLTKKQKHTLIHLANFFRFSNKYQ